jgi:hypothetical protein
MGVQRNRVQLIAQIVDGGERIEAEVLDGRAPNTPRRFDPSSASEA